jgi:hypothetical protein
MKPDKDIEQKLEQLADNIGLRDSFVNDVMNRIESSAVQPSNVAEASSYGRETGESNHVFRRILRKNTLKLTAAAIVITGVSAVFLFNPGPGSIALADVYAKVQQAQAFMCKTYMTMTGTMMDGTPSQDTDMEATITVSTEYGMKFDNTMRIRMKDQEQIRTQQIYVIPKQKAMFTVMPALKKYMRLEFSEDLLERMKQENNEPRYMIRQLMQCEYENLGFSEIDGVKVQGFRSTDPTYLSTEPTYFGSLFEHGSGSVTMWVDADTWLPVRTELDFTGESLRAHGVITDYQWDIQVDPAAFAPQIPEDYSELVNVKMSEMNAETAIE